MAHGRPNPFRGLHDVFTEMERMRRLGRTGIDVGDRSDTHGSAWVPAADIAAEGGRLLIRLDVPGVRADELGITFDRGVLTISGERGGGYADDATFYTRERPHGALHRTVILPEGVDETMITAMVEDGVVEISVAGGARSEEPSRIPVEDRSSRRAPRVGSRRPQ